MRERQLQSHAASKSHRAFSFHSAAGSLGERFHDEVATAFDEVWREHFAEIRAFLRRSYGNLIADDRVEQIAIDALARAWQRHDDYDPRKGELRPWLCTIADHVAADFCRSRQMQGRFLEIDTDPGQLSAFAGVESCERADETSELAKELGDLVDAALKRLPDEYAEVLWTFACSPDERVPTAELAAKYGVTAAAIRQRKCRGKALLAKELAQLGVSELLPPVTANRITS